MEAHRSRHGLRRFRRLVAALVAVPVAALVAIAAAEALVPDLLVIDELREGFDRGVVTPSLVQAQRTGGLTDHYGECVLLTIGLSDPPGASLFERAATSPNLHHCVATLERLQAAAAGDELSGTTKIRYWNGTSIVSRPVVATVGVAGLRLLCTVALIAALAWFVREIDRRSGRAAAVALLVGLSTIDLVGVLDVFHHTLMLAVGIVGVGVVGRVAATGDRWSVATAAAVAGSVYNVVDLMNYVTGLLALVIVVVVLWTPPSSSRRRAVSAAVAGAAWAVGYVVTWAGAWVVAAIATSPSAVFEEIRRQFSFRLDGETEGISGETGAGLRAVVDAWVDPPLTRVILVLVGLAAVASARRVLSRRGEVLVAGAAASLPVVFALVANNHHQVHFWFEYRSLGLGFSGLVMAWWATSPRRPALDLRRRGDARRATPDPALV